MRKIAVLTSGGDAPGMNAAIRAIVRTSLNKNISIIGFKNGYEGSIDRDYVVFDKRSVGNIIQKGGSILHTCLLYTSPSPRDGLLSRMTSSA